LGGGLWWWGGGGWGLGVCVCVVCVVYLGAGLVADTAGGGDKKAPNLGPTPQPSGNTTAGKIFIGGLNLDTTEEDLKAFFEVC